MNQKPKFVLGRVKNSVRNAGCLHFLRFPQCFKKVYSNKAVKSQVFVAKRLTTIYLELQYNLYSETTRGK